MVRNGLNPHWENESAEIVTSHPELAQLVVQLCYRPRGAAKPRVLGTAALPMSCVRQGVRSLQMYDEHGAPL